MKLFIIASVLMTFIFFLKPDIHNSCKDQKVPKIDFVNDDPGKKVDVMVDGKLFTSFRWPDSVMKPVLYPVLSFSGNPVTRGFPLEPRQGERTDHPHQVGVWLNYGDVNGIDFWGNSYQIPKETRDTRCGRIKHIKINNLFPGIGEGSIVTSESWIDPFGKELLAEKTKYCFSAKGHVRIIDRITTLTATNGAVTMKDTKEGMFGIRVARQLELPIKKEAILTDARNNPTVVKKMQNEEVTGNYRSSEGNTGAIVWGKRARWMNLYGTIGGENISLVVCDHPSNINYPTFWHAREYGLFAANPFGAKDFTNGKEELNYKIPDGQSITFRYRVIIASGTFLSDAEINAYAEEFTRKY